MKKEKARPLRWRLMVPLAVTFALLWLGVVALLFSGSQREAESSAALARQQVRDSQEECWQSYENNRANGVEDAGSLLREQLSNAVLGRLDHMDGGLALLTREEETGEVLRSQLTWGYGNEEGVDQGQRWYLTFDGGLDREGQLAFARWLIDHRNGWAYAVYPLEEEVEDGQPPYDGTWARVTGIQEPGHTLAVQKIELVHPDGTEEIMVETGTQGENPVTLELKYMQVRSVLLPSWSSDGKDGYTNMERRLDNYLEAQAILDRILTGEDRAVLQSGGFALGTYNSGGYMLRYAAGQYQTAPYVLRTSWGSYLALLVITALAALILSAKLSKKVTQPTEKLCRQAEEGRCLEDGPVTELNTLAAAFNAAQDRLENQLERERDFTRSAAHELKTPLAVLRTHAEALQEDIAPEKRAQYLDVVLDESDRMAQLVSRLLELYRLESGSPLKRERLELSALVREVWDPLSLQLERKGADLCLELEKVWLKGCREPLRQAVENLASNAVRHCPPGGSVRVELKKEGEQAVLTVDNDGEAMPEEDLPRLFEPFFRGDRSRSRDSGGTGLGLAVVRAAVLAHGGDCRAENRTGGVRFRVRLPLSGAPGPEA